MFFCKQVSKLLNPVKRVTLGNNLDFVVYDSAESVNAEEWNGVLQGKNVFLELEYLKTIELTPSENFQARYVIIYQKKQPYAIAYFQVIDFKSEVFGELMDSQVNQIKTTKAKLFEHYLEQNKDEVVMRLLTCGNNLVSGEHAFLFNSKLTQNQQFKIIEELIDKIAAKEKLRGKIAAVLVKDFNLPVDGNLKQGMGMPKCIFKNINYLEFKVEPNMVVNIPNGIGSIEAYLNLFSKKYRNRAKGILKNTGAISKRNLTAAEIKQHEKEIYQLYENVYNNAKFKLVKLPLKYFEECKKIFGDKFIFTAFYHYGKLVAFSSGLNISGSCYEAHYIGLDYGSNKELELYQNILYEFLSVAISFRKQRLNLGRTAAEIKSTIGAKPQELICYVKPQNTISKVVLKPFMNFLKPSEWIPRNPFKDELEINY